MKRIVFEFRDYYTRGSWKTRVVICESVEECIRLYGLNKSDVDFNILQVDDTDKMN